MSNFTTASEDGTGNSLFSSAILNSSFVDNTGLRLSSILTKGFEYCKNSIDFGTSFAHRNYSVSFEPDKFSYPKLFIFEDLITLFAFHGLKIKLLNNENYSRMTIREQ